MTKIYYMEKLFEMKIIKISQKKFCVRRDLTSLFSYKHCFLLSVFELFIQGRLSKAILVISNTETCGSLGFVLFLFFIYFFVF